MTGRVEYEVFSHADELIYTSPERDLAMRFARRRARFFPGVRIEVVEYVTTRRRLWTDRAGMRAAIEQEKSS